MKKKGSAYEERKNKIQIGNCSCLNRFYPLGSLSQPLSSFLLHNRYSYLVKLFLFPLFKTHCRTRVRWEYQMFTGVREVILGSRAFLELQVWLIFSLQFHFPYRKKQCSSYFCFVHYSATFKVYFHFESDVGYTYNLC